MKNFIFKLKDALPELLSRFVIGFVFIESGWGKFQNLDKVIAYFDSLKIPLAHLQAPFVSAVELIAGLMILFGIFTRWASLPLIAVMVVAIGTAKLEDVTDLSSLLGLSEFLYIVILVWLAVRGSQYLSFDSRRQ
jgi:putative oxidoreductase